MELTSVKRYSLSKQVSDKLEKMIENNEYKVGSKIPTEIELMELFGVSRNTIREAVQSLCSAGILDVKQGDGTYVKSNNRFDANMSMKLVDVKYDEINEARKILEIDIVTLASQRRTNNDLVKIKKALVNRQESKDDIKEHTLADVEFHIEIAKSAHNIVLLDLYKSLYSFLLNHIKERNKKTQLTSEEIDLLHEKLYLAIENKDSQAANDAARKILNI